MPTVTIPDGATGITITYTDPAAQPSSYQPPKPLPKAIDALTPKLLAGYWQRDNLNVDEIINAVMNHTEGMRYRPRSFRKGVSLSTDFDSVTVDDPGAFAGWDYLTPQSPGRWAAETRPDYQLLRLRRTATIGVAFPGSAPSWVDSSWTKGGSISVAGNAMRVWTKKLPAGDNMLGAPENTCSIKLPSLGYSFVSYPVLLAEADGTPTPDPAWPASWAAAGFPALPPGAIIGAGHPLHDEYRASGPLGGSYATWHPQFDPVFHVAFNHEHGSDPAALGLEPPLFGFLDQLTPMPEQHEGFKVFTFQWSNELDGLTYDCMVTQHMTTGDTTKGYHRVCGEFHSQNWLISQAGTVLARLYRKADFGLSRGIVHTASGDEGYILDPADCPANFQMTVPTSNGVRNIQVEFGGYESWQNGPIDRGIIPIQGMPFINIADEPITSLKNDLDANGVLHGNTLIVNPGNTGARRWFNTADAATAGYGWDASAAKMTGRFFTDYKASQAAANSDGGAISVPQFLDGSLKIHLNQGGHWFVMDPWTDLYVNAPVTYNGQDGLPRINRDIENHLATITDLTN